MKRLFTAALLMMAGYAIALAANTKQTVTQVTTAVSLTADVDYHITSTTPFTTTGSIDIVNSDHAVVIFDALKPSKAKTFLGYIKINGAAAKDGTNCQLRIWDRGAILLPYGGTTFRPLTVFDGDNFTGESFNTQLTEGHNNGFMKNMPTAWNNRVKSFKLKRGYMVTFALKKAGKGYSRCFIAANADLEMTLPTLMSERISSYRIFKWQNTSKVGVSDVNASMLSQLNAQTTFTWGPGSSMLPDAECVPHRIDESWPTPAGCGATDYSPHMKTNNEPRNEADHGTWTMEQILANWEAMMATGMRLCTPSSWDGSDYWDATGFLANFLNEIDKRGWRCDIIDLHGYWDEGSFSTNVNNWAQKFGRPVWITEWVWGSSWTPIKGIFKQIPNSRWDNPSSADLQEYKNVVSRILDNLNGNNACERYFYWNGERNCSKILRDGNLTPAGEYFATMKTNGPGYTGYGNYVPKTPPTGAISDLTFASYNARTGALTLKWSNVNGEFTEGAALQRKDDSGAWTTIYTYKGREMEDKASLTYQDKLTPGTKYSYRILDTLYTKAIKNSNTYVFYSANATGTANVQHGSISSIPGQQAYVYLAEPYFAEAPVIVCGSATYKNAATTALPRGVVNNPLLLSKGASSNYEYFSYQEMPWNYLADNVCTKIAAPNEETTNFIVAASGTGQIGELKYEAGNIENVKNTVVEVTFTQSFTEAPVVMVTPIHNNANLPVVTWRIYDVTKDGFKLLLLHQKGETKTFTARKVGYFAIEKGSGHDGQGSLYTVGSATETFKATQVNIEYGTTLENPIALAQLQTYNYQAAAIMRVPSASATSVGVRMQVDPTDPDKVLNVTRSATENVGYIIISTDPDYDGIGQIYDTTSPQRRTDIFDLSGRRLDKGTLHKGIYIINGQKVLVK